MFEILFNYIHMKMVELHISNSQLETLSHLSKGFISRLHHKAVPNCRIYVMNNLLEGLHCHMLSVIAEICQLPEPAEDVEFTLDMVSYNNVFKFIKYYYEDRYSYEIVKLQMNSYKNFHLTCYNLTRIANHLNTDPLLFLFELIVKYPEYSKASDASKEITS